MVVKLFVKVSQTLQEKKSQTVTYFTTSFVDALYTECMLNEATDKTHNIASLLKFSPL
jgi:hypothetical protein